MLFLFINFQKEMVLKFVKEDSYRRVHMLYA
jgi:hypothetical protein